LCVASGNYFLSCTVFHMLYRGDSFWFLEWHNNFLCFRIWSLLYGGEGFPLCYLAQSSTLWRRPFFVSQHGTMVFKWWMVFSTVSYCVCSMEETVYSCAMWKETVVFWHPITINVKMWKCSMETLQRLEHCYWSSIKPRDVKEDARLLETFINQINDKCENCSLEMIQRLEHFYWS